MGIIVRLAFLIGLSKVWIDLGPKIPLVFLALWGVGFSSVILLDLSDTVFFAFQVILTSIVLLIDEYQSAS